MHHQPALIVEDFRQALEEIVRALGGHKAAGVRLRPELAADKAGQWLRDCLSADRRERLSLEQVELLLAEGRRGGCHAGMAYLAQATGYAPPVPQDPHDEAAQLQREFIAAVGALAVIQRRLDTLGRAESARAA